MTRFQRSFACLAVFAMFFFAFAGYARAAFAQTRDAGVDATTNVDAGPMMAVSDAGAASTQAQPQAPQIRLPQTPAEKAEGEQIVGIEPEDNVRIANDDVMSYIKEKVGGTFKVEALDRPLCTSNVFSPSGVHSLISL